MNKNSLRKIYFAVVAVLISAPFGVFAQQGGTGGAQGGTVGSGVLQNPLKGGGDLAGFVKTILETIVVPLGATISVCFIIYSGFLFVTAQGNEEKVKEAKQTFFYTVIGTLVLLGAAVIAGLIQSTIAQLKS